MEYREIGAYNRTGTAIKIVHKDGESNVDIDSNHLNEAVENRTIVVKSVEALEAVAKTAKDGQKCYLDDGGRSGYFTMRTARKDENDGGTIFNGMERDDVTVIIPEMFGAIGDGINDDTIAINKACSLGLIHCTEHKTYIVSNTIYPTMGIIGAGVSSNSGCIKASSGFPEDSFVIDFGGQEYFIFDQVLVIGNTLNNGVLFGDKPTEDGANRGAIGTIRVIKSKIGYDITGWCNTISKLTASYCSLGLIGKELNGTTISSIVIEDCEQYFDIFGGGITINNITIEGTEASNCQVSSVIKGGAITIGSLYMESSTTYPCATPIEIGVVDSVADSIIINEVVSIHNADSDPEKAIIRFGAFATNCIISGRFHTSNRIDPVVISKKAQNIKTNYSMTYGYKRYKHQVETKKNLLGNGNFNGGLNIATKSYFTNNDNGDLPIISEETYNVLHGSRGMKVTFSAKSTSSLNYKLDASSSLFNKIKGRNIGVGAWFYTTVDARFYVGLTAYYDNSDTMYCHSSYESGTTISGRWNFIYGSFSEEIKDDLSSLFITITPVDTDAISDGDYILIDRIILSEGSENEMINDLYSESSDDDVIQYAGNTVFRVEPKSSTNDTIPNNFKIGDKYIYPDPSSSGYIGKICTADGQAFADWSDYGALA